MPICKWCYGHDIDDICSYKNRLVDQNALDWLGLIESDMCFWCHRHLHTITENLFQSFIRPYDLLKTNCGLKVPYNEIPQDFKKLGWCAFIHDHLREWTRGHYFKRRRIMYRRKNTTHRN